MNAGSMDEASPRRCLIQDKRRLQDVDEKQERVRSLLAATGAADRGVKRARFMGVLRGQNRPAILVEGGYLSNPEEARKIGTPAYRQKLAEAVAGALE